MRVSLIDKIFRTRILFVYACICLSKKKRKKKYEEKIASYIVRGNVE